MTCKGKRKSEKIHRHHQTDFRTGRIPNREKVSWSIGERKAGNTFEELKRFLGFFRKVPQQSKKKGRHVLFFPKERKPHALKFPPL